MTQGTLVITRADVARVLRLPDCIEAVERAFLRHARGQTIPPGVLGAHVDGGGFHVKTAGLLDAVGGRPVFAMKVNANFPGNPDRHGLPTIQGVIALFDGADGRLLALLDSIEITSLRTAAATSVAAKYLAPDGGTVTICGCGEQARSQLRALACVRSVQRVMALDVNAERATCFAADMAAELGVDVRVIRAPGDAARETTIWVTCTTARRWFLGREHVAPGAFVAAVGADNPEKQEIEPALLGRECRRRGRARAVRGHRRPASRDRRRPHAPRGRARRAGGRGVRAEARPAWPGRDRRVRQHGDGAGGCGGRRARVRARAGERRRSRRAPRGRVSAMVDRAERERRTRMDGGPLDWLARHEAGSLAGLGDLLAMPSVSTRTEHREDVARCAGWLVAELRRIGLTADCHATAGHPVVTAEWRGPAGRADHPDLRALRRPAG